MNRRALLSLAAGAAIVSVTYSAFAAAGFSAYKADEFARMIAAGNTIVVHVHADWCPTCARQVGTLDTMAKEFAYGRVNFVRVNFDTDTDFLKANRVSSQSTVIIFKGGREVSRFVGITRPQELRTRIDAAI